MQNAEKSAKFKPDRMNLVERVAIGANEGASLADFRADIAVIIQRTTLPVATMVDHMQSMQTVFLILVQDDLDRMPGIGPKSRTMPANK